MKVHQLHDSSRDVQPKAGELPKIDLRGKVILITGGSMGIGLACARIALQAGAKVSIVARDQRNLANAAADLRMNATQSDVAAIPADVADPASVERCFRQTEEQFGAITGVIHAAGIYGPIGAITDLDAEEWFSAIRVNLLGTFLVAKEACRRLKATGGGRVVLFSGGGAATPFPNYTAYACSKVAVVRLTETVAIEMAPYNIEVNCVAPGFVLTRLHDQTLAAGENAGANFLQKTKDAYESGAVSPDIGGMAAAFLVSDAANGISGRFIAAPYDDYTNWVKHGEQIHESDLFTLRRIVPKDRGMDWQ